MFVLPCQVVYNCGTISVKKNLLLNYFDTTMYHVVLRFQPAHPAGGGSSEPNEPPLDTNPPPLDPPLIMLEKNPHFLVHSYVYENVNVKLNQRPPVASENLTYNQP